MDQTLREGIETEQQQELLRRSGYSRGQGFLYARPMPAPAALGAVRARTVGGLGPLAHERAPARRGRRLAHPAARLGSSGGRGSTAPALDEHLRRLPRPVAGERIGSDGHRVVETSSAATQRGKPGRQGAPTPLARR